MELTTSTVFTPGWRCTPRMTPRLLLNHAATLSVCTPSTTRPSSPRRIGEPLRYVTMIGRYADAV